MSDAPAAERWQVPAIDGSGGQGFLTASRLQELQEQAHEEAFKQGYAEGLSAGKQETDSRIARLDALLSAQARPFELLDETVEQQLLQLAMSAVRQLFRRELKSDPGHVISVVREAVQLLPVASRDVRVYLHPDDASLLRESLSVADGERAWSVVEDPLIARGGCRVATESSQVDAQNETRLNA
ncbi:MAG: hypothetical protein KDI09_14535, partial [Halioglobus sp.]|nr:hypothetical protein [Halioglobus sp.]